MIILERFAYAPQGTFGRMYLPSGLTLFTVEDRDNNNAKGDSCIPEGEYECVPSRYHKGGYDAYEITGVPGRSRILIHAGNTSRDVDGCVAVGLSLGFVGGLWAATESKSAFQKFMQEVAGQKFTLQVRFYQPTENIRSNSSGKV
jgi:hypothetical protein